MAGFWRTMALSDGNWFRQLYNMLDFSIDDISATSILMLSVWDFCSTAVFAR